MTGISFRAGSALDGQTLTLTVIQNGSVSKTETNYGSPAECSISVVAEQPQLVAPATVYLNADTQGFSNEQPATDDVFDPSYHGVEYWWSIEKVGDPTWKTTKYTAPTNVPEDFKMKGKKFGKRIAHTFGEDDITGDSSTFRFVCTAIEPETGYFATAAAFERTISAPDAFWTADETFVVSQSGSTTGAPATNNAISSTIQDAFDASKTPVQDGIIEKFRVCIENGQTYSSAHNGRIFWSAKAVGVYGWGDGAKPEITAEWEITNSNSNNPNTLSYHFSKIKRTTTGVGFRIGSAGDSEPTRFFTFSDVDCERTWNFTAPAPDIHSYSAASNCSIVDTTINFGTFKGGPSKAAAYIGCRFETTPNLSNDDKSGGGYGFRPFYSEFAYVSQTSCFTRRGWFNNAPGIQTTQPWCRLWYGADDGQPGGRFMADRCYVEGKMTIFGARAVLETNFLVDRMICVSLMDTDFMIDGLAAGTVRNSQFINRNTKSINGFDLTSFIRLKGDATEFGSRKARLINSSFVSLSEVEGSPVYTKNGTPPDPDMGNNIHHVPYAFSSGAPTIHGEFNRAFNADPLYTGYNDRAGDDATEEAHYLISVDLNTLVGTFTEGETVTGGTSGVSKTYIAPTGSAPDSRERFNATSYTFEATPINDRIGAGGNMERFAKDETLTGQTSGATIQTKSAMYLNQTQDTGNDLIGLIPRTVTPTHVVRLTGAGGFVPGQTVSTGTGSATVTQEEDDRLYLRYLSGSIEDGQALTATSGSGTASGDIERSGIGDLWLPTTNTEPDGGLNSVWDMFGRRRTSRNAIKGPLIDLNVTTSSEGGA